MSNNVVNELYSSNKQLNIKFTQLNKKVEEDNKKIFSLFSDIKKDIAVILEQNKKIVNNINDNNNSKEVYNSRKESIEEKLQLLNSNK